MHKSDRMVFLCQTDKRYFDLWERGEGKETEQVEKQTKIPGPGTILERKIRSFGYRHSSGCGCQSMAQKMNNWGTDGCREKIVEIIEHLEDAASKTGWLERMAVSLPLVKDIARKAIRDLIEDAISEAESLEKQIK